LPGPGTGMFVFALFLLCIPRARLKIGDVQKDGFHEWNVPPEKTIERVEREWMAFKEGPNLTGVLDL
jgi:hypothetical protein